MAQDVIGDPCMLVREDGPGYNREPLYVSEGRWPRM